MVRIIDLSEVIWSSDEEDEEEESEDEAENPEEKPPDPQDPPNQPLAQDACSAPESLVSDEENPGPSSESVRDRSLRPSDVVPSIVRSHHQYVLYWLSKYGRSSELNRFNDEGQTSVIPQRLDRAQLHFQQSFGFQPLSGFQQSSGYQQSSRLANSPETSVFPQFTFNFIRPRTPEGNRTEDNSHTEHVTNSVSVTESSCQTKIRDETTEKYECSKAESDEPTKEKNNGLNEKEQLATKIDPVPRSSLFSSSDLSDYELSDASDSVFPPGYDSLHTEKKQEENATTDCPLKKDIDPNSYLVDDINTELTESTEKEPSEASDEGEAAALPLTSNVKDSWENSMADDRLFSLEMDAPAPSTSSGVDRIPSPETERRQIKLENRQRARELNRNAGKDLKRFILVPTEKIGRIVGKGGKRIKEIEKKTGAKIQIENRKSSEPVTKISLTGTDKQISAADEEICIIIRNFKPPKSGEPTTASVSSCDNMELRSLLLGIKNQVLDGEKHCRQP